MPHHRTTIRNAAAALLAPLGYTVVVGPVYPEQIASLPALAVLTPAEILDEERASMRRADGSVAQDRRLSLVVEIRAASTTDVLAALDAVALEVEAAIMVDPELGGAVKWMELEGTETDLTGEAEQPAGVQSLTFAVWYRVNMADPSAPIA